MEYRDLIIPKLNVNDNKVTIENLRYSNLDFVNEGDILYTVSTSKSIEDYECDFSGFIVFFVKDGDDIEIGKSAGMIFKNKSDAEIKKSQITTDLKFDTTSVSKKAIEYAKEINFDLSLIKKNGIIKTQDIDDYIKEHNI